MVDTEIRTAYVYKAKLAEQSLRFDDVLSAMMFVSEMNQSLTYEERNLLSTSYKKSIETRLFSYKVVQQVEDTEHGEFLDIAKDYRESYRYIAEIKDKNKTETIELAIVSYADAIDIARTALTGMNLIRLELALSYSMFYHDIMNDIDRAIEIASSEFHCAIVELDGTEHDTIDAIFQLIRVLKDKIDLWTEENNADSR
ncbi:14-3-3-like protein 1 [Ruditapes philippinarum]|uniref:14-3-3-like protein 1 n=1 Tax=Ruditapes philippinarum TaxID=129788 RepID=UPI00295A9171|nr:14-3-3-like protein 1 [Ruditapes philippinarum]